jgi:hypothetical protein
VSCQVERSQFQNRDRAMAMLKASGRPRAVAAARPSWTRSGATSSGWVREPDPQLRSCSPTRWSRTCGPCTRRQRERRCWTATSTRSWRPTSSGAGVVPRARSIRGAGRGGLRRRAMPPASRAFCNLIAIAGDARRMPFPRGLTGRGS